MAALPGETTPGARQGEAGAGPLPSPAGRPLRALRKATAALPRALPSGAPARPRWGWRRLWAPGQRGCFSTRRCCTRRCGRSCPPPAGRGSTASTAPCCWERCRCGAAALVAEENVRAVLTLNEEYETRFLCCSAQEWEALGVEQLRLGTVDLTGVPTLDNLHRGVEFILKHRERGNSVYVHCKAGRSRSATVVAAYLIQLHHWSPQEAIEAIAKIRPHILIRRKQVQVLESFHRDVTAGTTAKCQ
uniref:Phosphatidylglycerophosphatase and protein-tyrosine phosphatase 1 n=1 Tax=Gallus gallus TaxID=9031 RepID=A0A8V0ZND8_CHICK